MWTLGGTNQNYPGYGCLSGNNDVVVSGVVTLDYCKAQCLADASCKSLDFYTGSTRTTTCQYSYSDFSDVGDTTGTSDCYFYELTRA